MVATHNEDTVKFALEKYVLYQACMKISKTVDHLACTKCRFCLNTHEGLKALIDKGLILMA